MPSIKVSNDSLKAPEPVEAGVYEFRFEGFKPKFSKDKGSINLNPQLIIINNPKYDGSAGDGKKHQIFENLNTKAPWVQQDFVHSLGIVMEKVDATTSQIPGAFDGPEDNPEQWKYTGPLTGRTGKCEVILETYNGKPQNKIKQYICNVTNCAQMNPDVKHSTNLIKK